jgi:hypothetical protein
MSLNESMVEEAVLCCFKGLGYAVLPGTPISGIPP